MRAGAAYVLRRYPDAESERALFAALHDEEFAVRFCALSALFAHDPQRNPEPLVQELRSALRGEPTVPYEEPTPEEAAELGVHCVAGFPLVRWFSRAIDSADPEMRLIGVEALGNSKDPAAVALLQRARHDPEPDVARAAVESLDVLARALARTPTT